MIAFLRSTLFLLLAILITAPFGLLVTLAVVLPIACRFIYIYSTYRAGVQGEL